ncbi:hypothetical protein [Actinospongicola halichondriae]|uniref:hypothetical protein n=1 Tax=Actinospongicola halichondriae TaxID=3236844 RepID=UPI003D543C24
MKRILAAIVAVASIFASIFAGTIATSGTALAGGPPPGFLYNDYFESIPLTVNGDYEPLFLFCDAGDGGASILWYGAGSAPDHLWHFTSEDPIAYTSTPKTVNGVYEPLLGDFDGDGCDDIIWYTPGPGADYVWWGGPDDTFTSEALTINGTYEPVVGYFGEDDNADIFWYAPGSGSESFWTGAADRSFTSTPGPAVSGTYRVAAVGSAILFHRPGPGADYLWTDVESETGAHDQQVTAINGTYEPQASLVGFLLYAPGPAKDYALVRIEEDGTPYTFPATINGTYETGIRSPRGTLVHLWYAPGPQADYLWVPSRAEGGAADAFDASAPRPEFGGR